MDSGGTMQLLFSVFFIFPVVQFFTAGSQNCSSTVLTPSSEELYHWALVAKPCIYWANSDYFGKFASDI